MSINLYVPAIVSNNNSNQHYFWNEKIGREKKKRNRNIAAQVFIIIIVIQQGREKWRGRKIVRCKFVRFPPVINSRVVSYIGR